MLVISLFTARTNLWHRPVYKLIRAVFLTWLIFVSLTHMSRAHKHWTEFSTGTEIGTDAARSR